MSKHCTSFMILTVATLGITASLQGQSRRAVSSAELDAAVTVSPAGNREVVRGFLATDLAQKVAAGMGISTPELSARIATLDDASLNLLAQQPAVSDRTLAGGSDTIVISSTVVIIALLLIILLVK